MQSKLFAWGWILFLVPCALNAVGEKQRTRGNDSLHAAMQRRKSLTTPLKVSQRSAFHSRSASSGSSASTSASLPQPLPQAQPSQPPAPQPIMLQAQPQPSQPQTPGVSPRHAAVHERLVQATLDDLKVQSQTESDSKLKQLEKNLAHETEARQQSQSEINTLRQQLNTQNCTNEHLRTGIVIMCAVGITSAAMQYARDALLKMKKRKQKNKKTTHST